ncbi:NUDIX domain-containing protein [Phenylobacterium sp. LjRoot225]|uniref:NUDIX hydrolase n=1 Tax=Phenylobacterium sp. LjRoot225 TaxID=3342285 RepID=UPI003ECF9FFB
MRARPSARLLVVDPAGRVLLFRFAFRTGPLAGRIFWATPGGALEPGESFEDGARRELAEETGLTIDHPGGQIARREFVMRAPEGDEVLAEERYFLVRVAPFTLADAGWTELEREIMTEHRWWTPDEIAVAEEQIFPVDLSDMLAAALEAS